MTVTTDPRDDPLYQRWLSERQPPEPEPAVAGTPENPVTVVIPEPEEPRAAGLVTVDLGNAIATSGGNGPGVVSVPEPEAAELIRSGLAVRVPQEA